MCQTQIYDGRDTSDRDSWQHMHHYCDCIRFTNRAYSALGNWSDMKFNLETAIGGCDYVLARVPADFYMRPEIHLQKGKALRLYRQETKAVAEFMNAIKGNPTLAQAYVELADIQAKNKIPQEALKTVSEGLRHAPDSKPLKRRYTELGGKLPYPAPVANLPSPPSAEEASAQSKSPSTGPQVLTTPPPAIAPEATTPEKPTEKPVDSSPSTSETPKIGSPTNPWCRFCPDPVAKP